MRKVRVEVYSRVSGYYRPTSQWNKGKQEEFSERLKMKNPLEVRNEEVAKEQLVACGVSASRASTGMLCGVV